MAKYVSYGLKLLLGESPSESNEAVVPSDQIYKDLIIRGAGNASHKCMEVVE